MIAIAQFPGQASRPVAAPRNEAELDALSERRDELREQLQSLNQQRSELADQIGRLGSDNALRAGPMARLRTIDQRIERTETEITASDEQIAAAKARGVGNEHGGPTVIQIPDVRVPDPFIWRTSTGQGTPWQERLLDSAAVTVPTALATFLLLGGLMYWRISRIVKNQIAKLQSTQTGGLVQLQQSIDAIAVEIERVSENQRFVTKLVGEKPAERR